MHHAVLGTGQVGLTIANHLLSRGHTVCMGSRTAENPKALEWAAAHGAAASTGTYPTAVEGADGVWLCVSGQAALDVVAAAGAGLVGRVVVDVTNPLDFSRGFPPRLSVCNDDSLGERIQRAAPGARVVKSLNTLGNSLMVAPARVPGSLVFVSGDDAEAKSTVTRWLREDFGWEEVVDLGDISTSRGAEAWLLLWTRLYGALGTADFNLALVRGRP